MKRTLTGLLLAGVLSLLLWPASATAQGTSWKEYIEAAGNAYQQADSARAEKLVKAALREAEKFGEQDPRFAASLNNPWRGFTTSRATTPKPTRFTSGRWKSWRKRWGRSIRT